MILSSLLRTHPKRGARYISRLFVKRNQLRLHPCGIEALEPFEQMIIGSVHYRQGDHHPYSPQKWCTLYCSPICEKKPATFSPLRNWSPRALQTDFNSSQNGTVLNLTRAEAERFFAMQNLHWDTWHGETSLQISNKHALIHEVNLKQKLMLV